MAFRMQQAQERAQGFSDAADARSELSVKATPGFASRIGAHLKRAVMITAVGSALAVGGLGISDAHAQGGLQPIPLPRAETVAYGGGYGGGHHGGGGNIGGVIAGTVVGVVIGEVIAHQQQQPPIYGGGGYGGGYGQLQPIQVPQPGYNLPPIQVPQAPPVYQSQQPQQYGQAPSIRYQPEAAQAHAVHAQARVQHASAAQSVYAADAQNLLERIYGGMDKKGDQKLAMEVKGAAEALKTTPDSKWTPETMKKVKAVYEHVQASDAVSGTLKKAAAEGIVFIDHQISQAPAKGTNVAER